ncbi:hypothetical protein DSO57_1034819 [Entomophthora muscae]|uniref:Uncharacterized protein n=2 Tax=Entomophthora muscae TaxID=34485 RepID=A0ACC2TP05_9FUNG|nr:hypothetical protein DSO57_1028375 [Entomophthora muscae]KAJ9083425.1 hypothetical protein DSO57_1034819 [Entomophthora muscae]
MKDLFKKPESYFNAKRLTAPIAAFTMAGILFFWVRHQIDKGRLERDRLRSEILKNKRIE